MVGPFNFDEDETNRLPEAIPYHTPCGLPAELGACSDAEMKFEGGQFQPNPAATKPGEIHIDLDVPGSEERARQLIADGMQVTEVIIETEEVECPACGWGKDSRLVFNFPAERLEVSKHVLCAECGFEIELSPELHQLMDSLIKRPI
jgi:DNA-directed RNA polymerase subunit RPC12/RpoP